jgi:hypothetical protein
VKLNDRISVRCSDGITRTGTIIYIHPERLFIVLQFRFWRESFRLKKPSPKPTEPEQTKWRRYTPEEDRLVMISKNLAETARALGRTESSVWMRRNILRRRNDDAKQTRS